MLLPIHVVLVSIPVYIIPKSLVYFMLQHLLLYLAFPTASSMYVELLEGNGYLLRIQRSSRA